MRRTLALALALLLGAAFAQDKASERELKGARKTDKMKKCSKQALDKKLMGRARETFMSQCLKR